MVQDPAFFVYLYTTLSTFGLVLGFIFRRYNVVDRERTPKVYKGLPLILAVAIPITISFILSLNGIY